MMQFLRGLVLGSVLPQWEQNLPPVLGVVVTILVHSLSDFSAQGCACHATQHHSVQNVQAAVDATHKNPDDRAADSSSLDVCIRVGVEGWESAGLHLTLVHIIELHDVPLGQANPLTNPAHHSHGLRHEPEGHSIGGHVNALVANGTDELATMPDVCDAVKIIWCISSHCSRTCVVKFGSVLPHRDVQAFPP